MVSVHYNDIILYCFSSAPSCSSRGDAESGLPFLLHVYGIISVNNWRSFQLLDASKLCSAMPLDINCDDDLLRPMCKD